MAGLQVSLPKDGAFGSLLTQHFTVSGCLQGQSVQLKAQGLGLQQRQSVQELEFVMADLQVSLHKDGAHSALTAGNGDLLKIALYEDGLKVVCLEARQARRLSSQAEARWQVSPAGLQKRACCTHRVTAEKEHAHQLLPR